MLALLQRVSRAKVKVNNQIISTIGHGLLVMLCVEQTDSVEQATKLANKVISCRIFADLNGQMNKNVQEVGGGVLVVPQFTLAADTKKGNRPGFAAAALPDLAVPLFNHFVKTMAQKYANIKEGEFGADMKVELVNDGPVTIMLKV